MYLVFLLVGTIVFLYAITKEGARNTVSDALVIFVICLVFGVIYKYAEPAIKRIQSERTEKPSEFKDLKFMSTYDRVLKSVKALDFVKEYNAGDYQALAIKVDDFVKSYQKLYNSKTPTMSQQLDLMIDKRNDVLDTISSFFVCTPASCETPLKKQLLLMQSITYHMIRKLQQQSGIKKLGFPVPSNSISNGHFVWGT